MQRLDVIALEQRLGEQFPIRFVYCIALMKQWLRWLKEIECGIECAEFGCTFLLHKNQAAAFNRKEFLQSSCFFVQIGKGCFAGNTPNRAVEIVGPPVIGAGEGSCTALT